MLLAMVLTTASAQTRTVETVVEFPKAPCNVSAGVIYRKLGKQAGYYYCANTTTLQQICAGAQLLRELEKDNRGALARLDSKRNFTFSFAR